MRAWAVTRQPRRADSYTVARRTGWRNANGPAASIAVIRPSASSSSSAATPSPSSTPAAPAARAASNGSPTTAAPCSSRRARADTEDSSLRSASRSVTGTDSAPVRPTRATPSASASRKNGLPPLCSNSRARVAAGTLPPSSSAAAAASSGTRSRRSASCSRTAAASAPCSCAGSCDGRNPVATRTAPSTPCDARWHSSSIEPGSAHWTSSSTSRTGASSASVPSSRRTARYAR